jgi:hypothetical protein
MDIQIMSIFKLFNYNKLGLLRLGTKVAIYIDPRK